VDLEPVSDDRETEWGLSIESPNLGPYFPKVKAHFDRRRARHFQLFVSDAAEIAGVAEEDVTDGFDGDIDPMRASIFERSLQGALLTGDRDKVRALARVAAGALAGDDAAIMTCNLVLPAILELEAPHVRLIVDVASLGPRSGRVTTGSVRTGQATGDAGVVEALLAQLGARGLIADIDSATMFGPPQSNWYLTGFGHEVLKYLVDFPSHPSHVQPAALT
jgi:hypothetical protein